MLNNSSETDCVSGNRFYNSVRLGVGVELGRISAWHVSTSDGPCGLYAVVNFRCQPEDIYGAYIYIRSVSKTKHQWLYVCLPHTSIYRERETGCVGVNSRLLYVILSDR